MVKGEETMTDYISAYGYAEEKIETLLSLGKINRDRWGELMCPRESPGDCNLSSLPSRHPSDCDNMGFPCECICHDEHRG